MAQKPHCKVLVHPQEIMMANAIQIDPMPQLIIEKGNHHLGRVLLEPEAGASRISGEESE